MAERPPGLVFLGYGKWVRADRIVALQPIEGDERGEGRRTLVFVEGMSEPIVASRHERSIVADMQAELPARKRRSGKGGAPVDQDGLF